MSELLPASLRARLDAQLRLVELARPHAKASVPYFAHMRVQTGERTRDVLLGAETRVGTPPVVDWRSAPLAEAFFACGEGEDYEIDAGDRVLTGTLLERNLLDFEGGELSGLETPEARLRRVDGQWRVVDAAVALLGARPEALRRRASSPADVVLDAAQTAVVDLPAGRPVLLLGEAGFGKTTVALHRLARLLRNSDLRAAVLVPTEGLRRLSVALLERMGVTGVEVRSYERWAGEQARRAFAKLPERESRDASPAVVRVKRDPALREILAELARRRPGKDRPGGRTRRRDLLYLFGDQRLMEKLVGLSRQGLHAGMVPEVLEHTHVQFSATAEQEFAHVDADRLQTLDGRSLDDGTPTEDAGTLDTEDYAILFELDRLRAERAGERPVQPRAYDCLVLDEAQEFAPLELALMGRALAPGGTLIVAGDAAQQVDAGACFGGWPASMAELGCRDFHTAVLEVNYRCPPDVTELARRILDGGAGWPEGPSSLFVPFTNDCHQADWLTREIRQVQVSDPRASLALICRTPEAARRLYEHLRRGLGLRLALQGDYNFVGGINVTCVQESKGLEFDYVIIPDASAAVYPDTPVARRALYVAVTRASHQLIVSSVGPRTSVLPARR